MLKTTLKNKGKINYLILIIFILNSCTIEKRLHQKGFHVEWRKLSTNSNSSDKINEIKVEENDNFDLATTDSLNIVEKKIITLNSPEENQSKTPLKKKEIKTLKKSTNEFVFLKTKSEEKEEVEDETHDAKYEPLAIMGFISSLLTFLLPLLLLTEIAFLLMVVFGLFALIFSSIALVRIRKNKKLGKGFAIFGLVIGLIVTIISVLFLLLILILISTGF